MSVNKVVHSYVTARPESADPDDVSRDAWNAEHVIAVPFGQCKLTFINATTLRLVPHKGNLLFIPGTAPFLFEIPAAGIDVDTTGLAADTTYLAYVSFDGMDLVLALSPTAHSTDANTGAEIKTGDDESVLVGTVRTTSGTQFANSALQRFVASWFNDEDEGMTAPATADRTTSTTGSFVEIHTELRLEFVTFANRAVSVTAHAKLFTDTNGKNISVSIGFDGITAEDTSASAFTTNAGESTANGCASITKRLSEGYHYATMLIRLDAGTGNGGVAGSATVGLRSTMQGRVRV